MFLYKPKNLGLQLISTGLHMERMGYRLIHVNLLHAAIAYYCVFMYTMTQKTDHFKFCM